MSERSRTTIYQSLEPLLGEEAVGEMLSYFPARDVEEPASKEFIAAELARLEASISRLDAKVDVGLAGLESKIEVGLAGLDAKIDLGLAGLDAKVDNGLAGLRAEMHREFRAMVVWLVMAMVAIASAVGLVAR